MKNKKWCMPILMLLVGSFIPINVASAVAAESNNSNVSSIKEPGYYTKVDSTNFRASADSVATNEGRNGPADRVLDGDTNSFWSGRWGAGNGRTSMPMSLTICTADMNARNDISRASLVLRTSSNNSGRMKDYTVSITTETNITDNTQWTTLINESRPADDRSNVVIPLNDKSFTCMKVTYKSAWDGSSKEISNAASLAEVVFEQYHQGFQPIPQAPAGTGEGAIYPINSNAVDAQRILRPLAADERVADDAKQTPIALRLGERTIGARKSSTPAVAQVPQGRKAYYIDCSVPFNINAKGTLEDPWSSVDFANAHGDFNPGDFILLKRGSVCRGLLHPKGSGTAEQRITIDAYGDPNDNKPIIHALGQQETADSDVPAALKRQAGRGIESAAVRLFNQDYWVIRNLEITNYTNDHNDYQKIRRGVVVAAEDRGVTKGIEISDLYIHDVLGRAEKDLGGSGGIQFEAYAGDQVIPTWFEDLHVHHNVLKHVSRSGINEGSNFRSRTEVGGSIRDNPFQVWGPMDVHDNILSDIAGDAIVTQFASGTKVYNNTVWNYANHHGGKSPGGNNAGLWPWDADYVHYYNNHVFNSQMPNGTWDSTAFDADYGTTGTLFEYNVTHGNMGGFMLFCGCGGLSTNVTMRYNISINDGQGGERHNEGSRLFFAAGSADTKIHNNTFILYPGVNIVKGNGNNTAFTMVNNIFQANGDVKIDGNTNENIRTWAYNIYGGNSTFNWPDLDKEEHNNIRENNIEVGERVGVNAFQWEEQSNWIGRAIINKDIPDITGSTIVKWNDNPTRGAIQSPEHTSSASSTELVYDGGFELNKEGVHRSTWTSNTGSAIQRSSKFARSGQLSLAVQENEEISSEPISIGTHQTLRVLAAVKSAPEKNTLPTVQIRLSNGNIVTTKIYTASSEDNSDWTIVSSVFRTGLDTDRLEVLINGEGFVDDVSIINIPQQYAADPSLESVGNTVWSGGERVADNTFTGKLATKVNANQGAENRFVDIQARNQLIEVWVQAKKTAGDMRFGVKRFNDGDDQTSIPVTSSEYNSYSISLTPETSLITLYCYAKANSTGYCDDFLAVKPYTNAIPKHSGISYTPLDKVTVQTGQTPTLVNEIQVNWPDGTTTQENISWKDSSQWREVDDNTVEATGEFAGRTITATIQYVDKPVDTTSLQTLITRIKTYYNNEKHAENWKLLSQGIAAAEEMLSKGTLTQAEIDAQIRSLEKIIEKIESKSDAGVNTDFPDTTEKGTNTDKPDTTETGVGTDKPETVDTGVNTPSPENGENNTSPEDGDSQQSETPTDGENNSQPEPISPVKVSDTVSDSASGDGNSTRLESILPRAPLPVSAPNIVTNRTSNTPITSAIIAAARSSSSIPQALSGIRADTTANSASSEEDQTTAEDVNEDDETTPIDEVADEEEENSTVAQADEVSTSAQDNSTSINPTATWIIVVAVTIAIGLSAGFFIPRYKKIHS